MSVTSYDTKAMTIQPNTKTSVRETKTRAGIGKDLFFILLDGRVAWLLCLDGPTHPT